MDWLEISGSWALVPQQPIAIIHFLGGAFVASAPQITYRWLLEQLAQQAYVVIATPFINTLDHTAIARQVLHRFETVVERLQFTQIIKEPYLPIYGLGHSMGCKLHLLIGSLFSVQRAGNILISYNNYSARNAIPFVQQLEINPALNIEFIPSPAETNLLIAKNYQIRRNLLIKFNNDDIDQSLTLNPILEKRFPNMNVLLNLPGNHLTPITQELNWQTGEVFTPIDAIGQWLKSTFSNDLSCLRQEVLRWLKPF